ncbi:MAG: hypothetical protein ABEJ88_01370 [Halobacterium sp.]
MPGSNRDDGFRRDATDVPRVPPDLDPAADLGDRPESGLAPSEAFQTLASEVRVAVLVALLRAEQDGGGARSFSALQERVGSDSSAGFAYHLRQLDGHFVRKTPDGYVLTDAGRRAAAAVVTGAFTDGDQSGALAGEESGGLGGDGSQPAS